MLATSSTGLLTDFLTSHILMYGTVLFIVYALEGKSQRVEISPLKLAPCNMTDNSKCSG